MARLVTSASQEMIDAAAPGFADEPSRDQLVAWNRGTVLRLNLNTLVSLTSETRHGESGAGYIHGCFACSPIEDASFAFATPADHVHFFKNAN